MSFRVLGIGEVLWDLLPSGPQLGGAPANFAWHAQGLGAKAAVISRVGKDARGAEIQQRFAAMGLSVETLQVDDTAPTSTVSVLLSDDGIPQFTIHENVAWDRLEATEAALQAASQADAVCFGSLAQRSPVSREAIQRLVGASPPDALRILDVNLRQSYYSREVLEQSLRAANILKLNDGELPILAEMFGAGGSVREQIEHLARAFHLNLVALTRGAAGSLLYQNGNWSDYKAAPVQVVDTVGAGDAFTAALCLGLLRGMGLEEINRLAGEVAAYVCTCAGATPELRGKFLVGS